MKGNNSRSYNTPKGGERQRSTPIPPATSSTRRSAVGPEVSSVGQAKRHQVTGEPSKPLLSMKEPIAMTGAQKQKEAQKRYNVAARRWISAMVAMPVFLVTSYYLFNRCKLRFQCFDACPRF
jgi:hypothetical protein